MDGGEGHTTASVYLPTQTCALQMIKMVTFMSCVIYHIIITTVMMMIK